MGFDTTWRRDLDDETIIRTAAKEKRIILTRDKGILRHGQVTHGYWDQHSKLKKQHADLARKCDKPIAGLLADLEGRGLLDDTLVLWGGEFGRTPTLQGNDGRDHNPKAMTIWLEELPDIPLVQTLTFVFAVLIVFFNLVADVVYGMLDPRIRYD